MHCGDNIFTYCTVMSYIKALLPTGSLSSALKRDMREQLIELGNCSAGKNCPEERYQACRWKFHAVKLNDSIQRSTFNGSGNFLTVLYFWLISKLLKIEGYDLF